MKFAVITDIHGNAVAVDIIEVAYDDRPCLEAINAAPTPEKELLRKLFLVEEHEKAIRWTTYGSFDRELTS